MKSAVEIDQLKPFNSLIGSWRGVGQVKRGSPRGAWSEKLSCEWDFQHGSRIDFVSSGGQAFERLTLRWDSPSQKLVLEQQVGDVRRIYRGASPEKWPGKLQLSSEPQQDGGVYRVTLQSLSDIRMTLLFERRLTPTGSFRRVSGLGYTRSGATLAESGANRRTCVVTGGLGTIPVSHKGKTYYVCCQGCVQAFKAAPDEIIADYLASLKK